MHLYVLTGVRVTKNGRVFTDINAKMVISDAGVSNTFKQLLPIDLANKTGKNHLQRQSNQCKHYCD